MAQLTVSMSDKASIKIPSLCDAMTFSRCRFLALIRSSLARSDATPVGENLVLGNQGRSPLLDSKSEPLNDSSLAGSAGIPARLPYAAPFQVIGLNPEVPHVRSNYRFDQQWARATSDDDDFVVVFQPEDFVIFRSQDADALRKVWRFLQFEGVADTASRW